MTSASARAKRIAAATKVLKPVRHIKRTGPNKVSNWWYVVGFLVGGVGVFVYWWFIYPPVVSLFY